MNKTNQGVSKVINSYKKLKKALGLSPRHQQAFEYRYGLIDGKSHTYREIGEKLGVTSTRTQQLVARVEYKIEK